MIDFEWAQILATVAKADPRAIMAMHSALTSTVAQRAVFTALAKFKLTDEQRNMIASVEKATEPARRIRNAFCHQLWGTADSVKDALLLIDPITHIDFHISVLEEDLGIHSPDYEIDHSKMMVYTRKDLRDAGREMRLAVDLVITLHGYLGGPHARPPQTPEQMRNALLNSPLVAGGLQPQSRNRRSSPLRQPPPRNPRG